nr:hypothetical protein [Chloroflexota bacterium]
MDATRLTLWRDAALILLTLEAIALVLLPGVALYRILPAVRQLSMQARTWLFKGRLTVWKIQRVTQRVMGTVAAPFIWWRSTTEGINRAFKHLGWR